MLPSLKNWSKNSFNPGKGEELVNLIVAEVETTVADTVRELSTLS